MTVVGSGFTGIELATELAARFHVVLLERAEVLAPSLGDGPRETIAQALDKVGVEVRLGATLDRIDGSTTVWCGGMVGKSAHARTAGRARSAGPPHHRAEPGRAGAARASTPPATWRTPWPTTRTRH